MCLVRHVTCLTEALVNVRLSFKTESGNDNTLYVYHADFRTDLILPVIFVVCNCENATDRQIYLSSVLIVKL